MAPPGVGNISCSLLRRRRSIGIFGREFTGPIFDSLDKDFSALYDTVQSVFIAVSGRIRFQDATTTTPASNH